MRVYQPTDPLHLPRLTARQSRDGSTDGVLLPQGEAPRPFTKTPPEHHDDPDGANLFPGLAGMAITYPPVFVTSARQALLTGHRTLLAANGQFYDDDSLPEPARAAALNRLASPDASANEQTGLHRNPDGSFQLPATEVTRHLEGTVAVLCSSEPANFGSFLFRVLPKLQTLRDLRLGALPVLVHAAAPRWLEYLALAGVPARQIIRQLPGHLVAMDHAIFPSQRNPQAFLDPESRALCTRLAARCGSGGNRRLYVSRMGHSASGGSTRVMRNEGALVARLAAVGFEILEPERMTARAQVAAFAEASMVVGPAGAGLFNTIFCRPGTRIIDIESEPHWVHAHGCLFASCGHRYAIFEARPDPDDAREVHRSFRVNIEALLDRIANFTTDAPPSTPRPRQGTLDRVTPDFAGGWAFDPGGAAQVEILIDGERAALLPATLARADLAAYGPCGFRAYYGRPLAPGTLIHARFADTGQELARSPLRLND